MTSPAELIQTFRFQVDLTIKDPLPKWPSALGKGAFSECSGLTLEADVKEYLEGGFNFGVVRRVGRVKLAADRVEARHVPEGRRIDRQHPVGLAERHRVWLAADSALQRPYHRA